MSINTCSGAISFLKSLGNDSSAFYQHVAQKHEKDKDVFLTYAKENSNYVTQIERAYFGVITDAIEGCFAFDIDQEQYQFTTHIEEGASYSEVLRRALTMEKKIIECYLVAAEQSQYLMADIPRAFKLVAKKRNERIEKLQSLLEVTK